MKIIISKSFHLVFLIVFVSFSAHSQIVNDARNLDQVTRVMSFGDSLTYGLDVARDATYSARVGDMIGIPVLNRGKNGLTTVQALGPNGHIEDSLRDMPNPQIVMMTLSGNDIMFDRRGVNDIKNNMRAVFQTFQDRGAMVVFVAIDPVSNWQTLNHPLGFLLPWLWGNYYSELNSLANEMGVLFVPRALDGIWGNPNLLNPNDTIHPNASGHQLIADRVYAQLQNHLPGADDPVGTGVVKIEAEDFVWASPDSTAGNTGGACTRGDFPDVDFEFTGDIGGGCNLGWVASSESIVYRVNIDAAGEYEVALRLASIANNQARVFVNDTFLGAVTGGAKGWQTYDTLRAGNAVFLPVGAHDIRIDFPQGEVNLNYLTVGPVN